VAEIVCYVYSFHQIWPVSLHYLVKRGCCKFLHTTGFITIRLLRFGVKVKWHAVTTTFLLRGHFQACTGCPRTILCVFQQDGAPAHWQHNTVALLERETCHHLSAYVRVHGAHFKHKFWQFWARLSRQLITLLNKPYSVYCVLIQSSDSLLQLMHFNVM